MNGIELKDLWTFAAVILGFGLGSIYWRLNMEAHCRRGGALTWLIPGDYLNLASLLLVTIGGCLLPLLSLLPPTHAVILIGLAVLLFVGHAFAMLAHYELFVRKKVDDVQWFPTQEKIVICVTAILAVAYLGGAYARRNAISALFEKDRVTSQSQVPPPTRIGPPSQPASSPDQAQPATSRPTAPSR